MALNMVHKFTKTEVWPVVAAVASGDAVVSATPIFQPGFAITSRGDVTTSKVVGPYTVSGIPGNTGTGTAEAVIAVDGAFRYDVTGASASTARNAIVYAVVSSGEVTSLTLTASTNKPFGKIDRFLGEASSTECSVWVGNYIEALV